MRVIAHELRQNGVSVALCDTAEEFVKEQKEYANRIGAKLSVMIGDSEIEERVVSVKNIRQGTAYRVALEFESLLEWIKIMEKANFTMSRL